MCCRLSYARDVEKVFAFDECTDRYVMLTSSWREVQRAAKAAGMKVDLKDATTNVSDAEAAAAGEHPGKLVRQQRWNDWKGDWTPL